MTRLLPLAVAATLLAFPVVAQDSEDGGSLLDQGANMILRGLLEEVAPPLQELAGISAEVLPTFQILAQEMGPAFVDVLGRVDSITNYQSPEILPNGDIVLRRSPDAPAWTPSETDAEPDSAPEPELPPEPPVELSEPERPQSERPEREPEFDLTPPPEADPAPDLDLDGQSIGPEVEL
jgi:hypothetical protein